MSLELIIRPEAEADVREAYGWYNEQLPGLGQELLAELDREFALLLAILLTARSPRIWEQRKHAQ